MEGAIIMPRDHAEAYALTFPGAYAEHPWGQTVIKVKRKVFLFVNGAIVPEDGVSLSVKLPQSGADVLQLPLAEPMGYGMGKHGWVTLLIMRDDQLPLELLEAWIDESYRAVAPRRLLTELDALHEPHRSRDEQLP
jgi:predicted DNA-binding protein (MmcQ/YjbR family)